MRELQYGEAFERLGVPDMDRIGAPGCGLAPDGVMVFMAHQDHFRKEEGRYYYVDDVASDFPLAPSAIETDRRMQAYFESGGRRIRLIVARFRSDGSPTEAPIFAGAVGIHFEAELAWFRPGGLQRAVVVSRHPLPPPRPARIMPAGFVQEAFA
jgi:hypothetical protein